MHLALLAHCMHSREKYVSAQASLQDEAITLS